MLVAVKTPHIHIKKKECNDKTHHRNQIVCTPYVTEKCGKQSCRETQKSNTYYKIGEMTELQI